MAVARGDGLVAVYDADQPQQASQHRKATKVREHNLWLLTIHLSWQLCAQVEDTDRDGRGTPLTHALGQSVLVLRRAVAACAEGQAGKASWAVSSQHSR